MPTPITTASAGAAILERQGYKGHGSRVATVAKAALTACRSGDVACAATFLFRDKLPTAPVLLVFAYIIYRSGITLTKSTSREMRQILQCANPFLLLGTSRFRVEEALKGSYLHYPVKSQADGISMQLKHLMGLRHFVALDHMEQLGTIIFVCYMRSVRLAKYFVRRFKQGPCKLTNTIVEFFRSTQTKGQVRRAFLPPNLVRRRNLKTGKRSKSNLRAKIKPNTDVGGMSLSSCLEFVGQFLDFSLDGYVEPGFKVPIDFVQRLDLKANRLMPNHILQTLKFLKLLSDKPVPLAEVGAGTAATKFLRFAACDLATLHEQVSALLHGAKGLGKVDDLRLKRLRGVWDESYTSVAACKAWTVLTAFSILRRSNWIGEKEPVEDPRFADI